MGCSQVQRFFSKSLLNVQVALLGSVRGLRAAMRQILTNTSIHGVAAESDDGVCVVRRVGERSRAAE